MVAAVPACGGKTILLGRTTPPPFHFGAPVQVVELADTGHRDNPTLTADLLEIYFTSNEDSQSNGDVWSARRAGKTAPFGTAVAILEVNTADRETSSAISADGLTLWFGSDRAGGSGGLDVWVSRRTSRTAAWSAPVNLTELNTTADDIPRPPGQHQLVMPLASTKKTPFNAADRGYQTYLASRNGVGDSFRSPVMIPEIDRYSRLVVDGSLSDDGLSLFFSSTASSVVPQATDAAADGGAASDSDIFVAFRASTDAPFVVIAPVAELNSKFNDRDPWLSPDQTVFFFTSDRDGGTYIYQAAVLPR